MTEHGDPGDFLRLRPEERQRLRDSSYADGLLARGWLGNEHQTKKGREFDKLRSPTLRSRAWG